MLWDVKALFVDRAEGIAALAAGAAESRVILVGLRIRMAWNGRIADQLVLETPGGWRAEDVERLCVVAGASTVRAERHLDGQSAELTARRMHPSRGERALRPPPPPQVVPPTRLAG